jgi:cytochrome c peroxidase
VRLAAVVLASAAGAAVVVWYVTRSGDGEWTPQQLAVLRSLSLASLDGPPTDSSNRFAQRRDAARLGRSLFFDSRLSANGKLSCSSCHQPRRFFQDGRPRGRGIGVTPRRTMAIVGAARQTWLFWDGRKDSLWSQALGPLENPREHGLTRREVVRRVAALYPREYRSIFGRPPRLDDREAVNRAFTNVGKAIAAFEMRLELGPARFDRYVAGEATLSAREIEGLRLFIGPAHCVDCHSGPLFTNGEFHNTGVRPNESDVGRERGVELVRRDEFNCFSRYSDAAPGACALRFLPAASTRMRGAFKPPSLRNVTRTAPYMHAGQIKTLRDVLRHYDRARPAPLGHSELHRLRLSDSQLDALVAFLGTLESPVRPRQR